MKLLVTLTAACSCLLAYSAAAVAAEVSADAATESVDPTVSGVLPSSSTDGKPAAAPGADKQTSSSTYKEHTREAKNAIYLDLLGPGLLYSINYDREILDDVSVRIGFSYFSYGVSVSAGNASESGKFSYLSIPITASYLGVGSENNMLEVGGGGMIMNFKGNGLLKADDTSASASGSITTFAMTGIVGYRHQPSDGGFVFRVGASPVVTFGYGVIPWGYLSLGAAF
ncbi:MAG TPA: hypothetical protein VG963_11895 [Polyangiaceae bacterium]|nr:hypothetical protein [Polyangiaceae bacterium]